ncbi:cystathionine gamma-synthase [Aureococcus anophagefferens]|nr:cystathionine gamma-synthase [Aureococcus anophagefferens]
MADDATLGFDTLCLHGAYKPDTSVTYGLGQGAPRGVPLHRTTPYQFVDRSTPADLLALKLRQHLHAPHEPDDARARAATPCSRAATRSAASASRRAHAVFYSLINLAPGRQHRQQPRVYGGTYTQFEEILPQFGIEVRFVDAEDPENRQGYGRQGSVVLRNGTGLPVVVDTTFSTPYLCKPFEFGVGVIVSSLAKASRRSAYKLRALTVPLRNLGGCISPDNSWMVLQGIETLSLRMERHCENAMTVAKHLKMNPKIAWVRYPGLVDDPQYQKAKKYLKGKGGSMVDIIADIDQALAKAV